MAKNASESTGETPGVAPVGKGHATPTRKERERAAAAAVSEALKS